MKRVILAQGDRDGACFLYSIANAVGILTEKVKQGEWNSFIKSLPIKIEDFLHSGGTGRLNDNQHLFEGIAQKLIERLGLNAKITSTSKLTSARSLGKFLSKKAVIVTCIEGGKHWVVISDVAGNRVYMACSAEALENLEKYEENSSPIFKRIYNIEKNFKNLNIHKRYGLQIELQ